MRKHGSSEGSKVIDSKATLLRSLPFANLTFPRLSSSLRGFPNLELAATVGEMIFLEQKSNAKLYITDRMN